MLIKRIDIPESQKIIFESVAATLVLVNTNKEIVYANDLDSTISAALEKEMTSYAPGDVLNCLNAWSNNKPNCGKGKNCDNCKLRFVIEETLKTRKTFFKENVELDIYHNKEIKHIDLLVSSSLITINNESYALLSIDDISQQKEYERKLKNVIEEKNRLISIISHDLRGPLGAIKNMISLLYNSWGKYDEERVKKILSELNLSAQSSYQLLEDLLSWAKNQISIIEHLPKPFNISLAIEESVNKLEAIAKTKDIKIKQQLNSDANVYADLRMIETVLRNVISNAIKFSHPESDIVVQVSTNNTDAIISIQDKGVGINKDTLEELFSESPACSTEGTKGEKGSGLGLVITQGLVIKNKGKIWAESLLGEGSTFYISIPLYQRIN